MIHSTENIPNSLDYVTRPYFYSSLEKILVHFKSYPLPELNSAVTIYTMLFLYSGVANFVLSTRVVSTRVLSAQERGTVRETKGNLFNQKVTLKKITSRYLQGLDGIKFYAV